MSSIKRYKNGNYTVAIDLDDGTKIRYNDLDFFEPEYPESMDITISNKCNMGCEFCYAGCHPGGEHADILSESFIDKLHPYTELALNGNEPMHPDLVPFLEKCKQLKLIPSLTVNQTTFMKNIDFLRSLTDDKLIYGLGISLTNATDEFIESVKDFSNAVIHVICGLITEDQLMKLANNDLKILILGYKTVRRGKVFYDNLEEYIEKQKKWLYDLLPTVVNDGWFNVVSFDNLAIEQLKPKRLMSDDKWNEFYLGDDGQFSMYIDMVNKTFSKNSMSTETYDLLDNVKDMFNIVKNKGKE